MNNRSNPINAIITLFIFVIGAGYLLTQAGIVSGIMLMFVILLLLAFFLIIGGLRIIDQFDRGVVLTLGKYTSTGNPACHGF